MRRTSRISGRILTILAAWAFLLTALAQPAAADPIKFARYPHTSHGKVAFTYHGDIWVADLDGKNPYRLTAHVAMDEFPRFSPDGNWVAFNSNRMGNDDIYVVPVTGGVPRQVTFHTTGDRVLYWTPDGERILFSSSRSAHPFMSPLYTVAAEGGLPVPMDMAMGASGMIRQDGSMIAFNRKGFSYWRKGYRGNNNTDIYVQDLGTKEITQLTDLDLKAFREHTQDAHPMWGADGMIYFMSEKDGIFNIWKIAPTGGDPVQVTRHRADGVQYPSISPDGRTIVYENEFELWRLDIPGGRPQKIAVDLAFDPKVNQVEYLRAEDRADDFSPSPDGEEVAVSYHGEIVIVPADPEKGEKRQVTSSPWRDWRQVWSPDGKYLAYISDESLEEEIWLFDLESGERSKLTDHASLKSSPVWSRDGSRLAFEAANRLFLAEAASGRVRELAYNEAGGYSVSEFSPDGRWLVYSRSDEDLNSEVYLYDIDERREVNVTDNPWREGSGALTPDGKWLLFSSNRDDGTSHLFKVSLTRMTEDPEDPLVKARKEEEASGGRDRGDQEQEEEQPPALTIETEGIGRRAIQLTSGSEGVYDFFLSADGKTIYYTTRTEDGTILKSIGLDGEDDKEIAEVGSYRVIPTADRKMVFWTQRDGLYRMPVSGRGKEQVRFDFTVTVDRKKEWRQIFQESWRTMKYRFYDEDMHGVDWEAMRRKYEPLLSYVGVNQDLYDLTNEMIGELNASHTGVSGPSGIETPDTYRTAYPGFELKPDGRAYRVSHVYRDGPADREWVAIEAGDYLMAIDGQAIEPPDNYWKFLNHTLNDYVTLTVSSSASGRDSREVRVQTVNSLRNIQYEEWVWQRRKMVEEWSDGQIAYVHIRSMNRSSLERFENEIDRFWNAKGIIVDIRYNGGGNIDQQLLDILERRPYEYWNNRWGARSWGRRPRQAIAGPKVMLINWRSASDSEVTPKGFRDLGLGTIVGTPTYGAVIATGSYGLLNGGRIRTPGSLVVAYDPTKPNNYGVNLENYGVAPDIWVENSPQDELDGFDRELKTAVDEALKMLAQGRWQYEGGR
ncbi:MAG: S41 family peptidase [bacterium]